MSRDLLCRWFSFPPSRRSSLSLRPATSASARGRVVVLTQAGCPNLAIEYRVQLWLALSDEHGSKANSEGSRRRPTGESNRTQFRPQNRRFFLDTSRREKPHLSAMQSIKRFFFLDTKNGPLRTPIFVAPAGHSLTSLAAENGPSYALGAIIKLPLGRSMHPILVT